MPPCLRQVRHIEAPRAHPGRLVVLFSSNGEAPKRPRISRSGNGPEVELGAISLTADYPQELNALSAHPFD
jgi:hypothetical protein